MGPGLSITDSWNFAAEKKGAQGPHGQEECEERSSILQSCDEVRSAAGLRG